MFNIKNRKFLFIFLFTSVIFLASILFIKSIKGKSLTCKSKKDITIELGMFAGSNWNVANGDSYHTVDKAIILFEAAHPGVKVHYYSGIRKANYDEWLSEQIISGSTPDVFFIPSNRFTQLIKNGVLKDLTSVIEKDGQIKKWEYFTPSWNAGEFQGKQYALPYQTDCMLMAVNMTLLKNKGLSMPNRDWTWKDFYRLCTQTGLYGYTWQEAVYSNGVQIFDESGTRAAFSDTRTVEAIRFMQKLEENDGNRRFTASDFDEGKVAFMPMSYAQFCTYISYPYKVYKDLAYEWGCLPMPAGPSGGNISQVNTLLIGISSKTKNKKLAYDLLKTLVHDLSVQTDIYSMSQGASPLRIVSASRSSLNVIDSYTRSGREYSLDLVSEILNQGVAVPKFAAYSQAMAAADNTITQIIEERQDADTSLRVLQQSIYDILAK